jgi:hypothetical protein
MGLMEFRWGALPDDLLVALSCLPDPAPADGAPTPAEAELLLLDAVGPTPDDAHARDLWLLMREGWILPDPERTARIAAMLDALEVGRTARASAEDDADFLRAVRTAAGLRHAVVRYVIAVGSPVTGPATDPVEAAAAPDRRAAEPVPAGTGTQPIPSSDFAPRTAADFARLASMNDLLWGLFMMQLYNAVQALLPGETIVVRSLADDVANDGENQGSFAVSIAHGVGGDLTVVLSPEAFLPAGLGYDVLRAGLTDLGWQRNAAGTVFAEFAWPDGSDDAVAVIAQTFRSVFLVDNPVRLEQSDEIRPPGGTLPAAPADGDVIRPESPEELLAVVAAVIRAAGGTVLAGADPLTFAVRIGPWTGWVHADPGAPLLDVVIVVTELSDPAAPRLEADDVLAMQATGFRFGRMVVTPRQALLAASAPFDAFTPRMVHALIGGLIDDATRAVGLATSSTPLTPGLGGYL